MVLYLEDYRHLTEYYCATLGPTELSSMVFIIALIIPVLIVRLDPNVIVATAWPDLQSFY